MLLMKAEVLALLTHQQNCYIECLGFILKNVKFGTKCSLGAQHSMQGNIDFHMEEILFAQITFKAPFLQIHFAQFRAFIITTESPNENDGMQL